MCHIELLYMHPIDTPLQTNPNQTKPTQTNPNKPNKPNKSNQTNQPEQPNQTKPNHHLPRNIDVFQHAVVQNVFDVHKLHHITDTADTVYFPNFPQPWFNVVARWRVFQNVHQRTFLDPVLRCTATAAAAAVAVAVVAVAVVVVVVAVAVVAAAATTATGRRRRGQKRRCR